MHKHNICDVTKCCHNHLLPSSSRKTLHMHLRAVPACLPTHWCPSQLFFYSYAWNILSILYPKFRACDICICILYVCMYICVGMFAHQYWSACVYVCMSLYGELAGICVCTMPLSVLSCVWLCVCLYVCKFISVCL